MTSANDRQVGGDHYKADFQHWDLMIKARVPYMEGLTTRYLLRYKRKKGAEDLQKGIHCIVKTRESWLTLCPLYTDRPLIRRLLNSYPELPDDMQRAIVKVLTWQQPEDLYKAEELVQATLALEYPDA